MIAVVNASLGRGVVLSVHTSLTDAVEATPRDVDGCKSAGIRYWRVASGVKPGQIVVIS